MSLLIQAKQNEDFKTTKELYPKGQEVNHSGVVWDKTEFKAAGSPAANFAETNQSCTNIEFLLFQQRDKRKPGTEAANLPWTFCCPERDSLKQASCYATTES